MFVTAVDKLFIIVTVIDFITVVDVVAVVADPIAAVGSIWSSYSYCCDY